MNILFWVTFGAFVGVTGVSVKNHLKYRRTKIAADAYRNAYVAMINEIDAQTGQENFKEVRQYVELIEEMR